MTNRLNQLIRKTRLSGNTGAALIEVAMVLPAFIAVVIVFVSISHFFLVQHTIQYATREGARAGIVGRSIDNQGRTYSILKTIEDNSDTVLDSRALEISIFPVEAPDFAEPADWKNMQDPGEPEDIIRIITIYEYQFLQPLSGFGFPDSLTKGLKVRAEATFRNERFLTPK
jgi:hypothetical protein